MLFASSKGSQSFPCTDSVAALLCVFRLFGRITRVALICKRWFPSHQSLNLLRYGSEGNSSDSRICSRVGKKHVSLRRARPTRNSRATRLRTSPYTAGQAPRRCESPREINSENPSLFLVGGRRGRMENIFFWFMENI